MKANLPNLIFICLLAAAAHFLYSPLGFNPTDDGFILAYAKRIFLGEIPHLEHISIRPQGSPILHHFLYYFFDDHLLLASRGLVCLQLAIWTGIWLQLFRHFSGRAKMGINGKKWMWLLGACVLFTLGLHQFPLLAWHTIDGLLLGLLGFWLCEQKYHAFGFLLLGLSTLCKQNFLALVPLFYFFYFRQIKILHLPLPFLPILGYVFWVFFHGGLPNMLSQLTAEHSLWEAGFLTYAKDPYFLAILGLLLLLAFLRRKISFFQWLYHWTIPAFGVGIFALLGIGKIEMTGARLPFALGFLIWGVMLWTAQNPLKTKIYAAPRFRLLTFILGMAWMSGISMTYNTPVFLLGPLIWYLLLFEWPAFRQLPKLFFPTTALLVLLVFHHARTHHIYRDLPQKKLTYEIGHLLPGGKGIYTGKSTFELLESLGNLAQKYPKHAVIPDFAAYWIHPQNQNPLPIDWPSALELQSPDLLAQTIAALPKAEHLFIAKYYTRNIAFEQQAIEKGSYPLIDHIRQNLPKVAENEHFEVYGTSQNRD